jgi:hypothetical protein
VKCLIIETTLHPESTDEDAATSALTIACRFDAMVRINHAGRSILVSPPVTSIVFERPRVSLEIERLRSLDELQWALESTGSPMPGENGRCPHIWRPEVKLSSDGLWEGQGSYKCSECGWVALDCEICDGRGIIFDEFIGTACRDCGGSGVVPMF